ncbi:MAG: VTC domain-containing protein, partial [Chloroflexi bacterium]|nr:VTC domain-containing protein [Chloroflexota bacterium]
MSASQPPEQELRYELKLTCAAHWLPQARMWLRLHPEGFRVEHASRQVNNLYLDTPDLDYFKTNLAGLSERRKLRLRWYGELAPAGPDGQIPVQPILELKHKTNMLGGKKQFILPALLDLAQPWAEILVTVRQDLPPEWRPWLEEA